MISAWIYKCRGNRGSYSNIVYSHLMDTIYCWLYWYCDLWLDQLSVLTSQYYNCCIWNFGAQNATQILIPKLHLSLGLKSLYFSNFFYVHSVLYLSEWSKWTHLSHLPSNFNSANDTRSRTFVEKKCANIPDNTMAPQSFENSDFHSQLGILLVVRDRFLFRLGVFSPEEIFISLLRNTRSLSRRAMTWSSADWRYSTNLFDSSSTSELNSVVNSRSHE